MEQGHTASNDEAAPAGELPRRARPISRKGKALQPMAGARQKIIGAQLETVEFANRRKKNRARRALAKASRAKNRGK